MRPQKASSLPSEVGGISNMCGMFRRWSLWSCVVGPECDARDDRAGVR